MPRKQRAQQTLKGIETATDAQAEQMIQAAAQAATPGLAPWQRKQNPWLLAEHIGRDLHAALLQSPGDPGLTTALGQALEIHKLNLLKPPGNKRGNRERELLNAELRARWETLLDQLELLAEKHSLPLYDALTLSMKQQSTNETAETEP